MLIPAIIFTRHSKILFCLSEDKFLEFELTKNSPTSFAKGNNLVRHDKFDWHVNKTKPICFFFEFVSSNSLPVTLTNKSVEWLSFPEAAKKLTDGTQRNLLQLAVQYISYGGIDESVIAADYDEEWLKNLLS